jgi:hypothetical protein
LRIKGGYDDTYAHFRYIIFIKRAEAAANAFEAEGR